jgi:L-threonylcarbamoyladenylate synthase
MSSSTIFSPITGFERAVALLRAGELVAFPTDTVYGVGALCWDGAAVARLYAAKVRSLEKAIPVLLADMSDLALVAVELSPLCFKLAERFWPGPLTLVVPKAARVSLAVTAGGDTVAVRIPDLALTRSLIRAAGAPLATTSANLSNAPPPVTAEGVAAQLGRSVALILDGGKCPGGIASTVVDVTGSSPRILRDGPLTYEQIQSVL